MTYGDLVYSYSRACTGTTGAPTTVRVVPTPGSVGLCAPATAAGTQWEGYYETDGGPARVDFVLLFSPTLIPSATTLLSGSGTYHTLSVSLVAMVIPAIQRPGSGYRIGSISRHVRECKCSKIVRMLFTRMAVCCHHGAQAPMPWATSHGAARTWTLTATLTATRLPCTVLAQC